MHAVAEIIDSDGHIFERDSDLRPYLEGRYPKSNLDNYYFFPSIDAWRRRGAGGKNGCDASAWLAFLDGAELSATVLYPTSALGFGFARDASWCVDVASAYNSFVYDRYVKVSPRLQAVALLPMQDPRAAAAELRRAVNDLGMVGGLLPAVGLRYPYGEEVFDSLYEEADALGTTLAVHGAPRTGLGPLMEEYPQVGDHHAMALMIQFSSMIRSRVFARFPRMRVAFLEASCGWVPYMIERIDHRINRVAGNLASDQVRDYPVYFHADLEDRALLVHSIALLGDDRLLFASDYPHESLEAPDIAEAIERFLARPDLTADTKRKILCDNVKALYGLRQ